MEDKQQTVETDGKKPLTQAQKGNMAAVAVAVVSIVVFIAAMQTRYGDETRRIAIAFLLLWFGFFLVRMSLLAARGNPLADAPEPTEHAAKRTEKATGTIVGGTPSGGMMLGGRIQALPMAEFRVGGEVLHACGPVPNATPVFEGEAGTSRWGCGRTFHIASGDARRFCVRDATQFWPGSWAKQFDGFFGDDGASREAMMEARYAKSVFSVAMPLGSEVLVEYDPDDPQGNCAVVAEADVDMAVSASPQGAPLQRIFTNGRTRRIMTAIGTAMMLAGAISPLF